VLEFADGEKAPPRSLPQTRSSQPQPAYDADAMNRAAQNLLSSRLAITSTSEI